LSQVNVTFKYAHGTNLLIPEHTDVSLAVEFSHNLDWFFIVVWQLLQERLKNWFYIRTSTTFSSHWTALNK